MGSRFSATSSNPDPEGDDDGPSTIGSSMESTPTTTVTVSCERWNVSAASLASTRNT